MSILERVDCMTFLTTNKILFDNFSYIKHILLGLYSIIQDTTTCLKLFSLNHCRFSSQIKTVTPLLTTSWIHPLQRASFESNRWSGVDTYPWGWRSTVVQVFKLTLLAYLHSNTTYNSFYLQWIRCWLQHAPFKPNRLSYATAFPWRWRSTVF